MEKKEHELWRVSLLFLALLATGLAVNSWETIRALPRGPLQLDGLPAGVFVLALLFAGYVWHKKREIDQMRGFVRALQEREQAPPSATQLERLMEIVTKSQRGYRDLIDSFDDLVFALSLDGELRAANKRVIEIFDLPFSEVVGRKLDDLIDEPTRAQAEKELTRFLERRHWSGTVRVRVKRTGAVRYFECILHPILKPEAPAAPGEVAGGSLAGIGGIARDVTQLRESETRFSELFATLQEGVYFTTPEGKLLDANPALVHMLGYASKEELLGVAVQELYWDPAERQSHLSELDRASTMQAQEITLRRKDGQPIVCLDTSTAIRDPLGRVVRYQGTLLDITHRREMEKRLREEQEFARRMIECLPDSIVVLDPEGRYTYASPRITEQLGYLPDELIGRSLGERSDPDDRRELLRVFDDVVHGRSSFATLEYRTRHKDGSWRRFRATAGPLYDAGARGEVRWQDSDGVHRTPEIGERGETSRRIVGVIAAARDITQLKQLEQQLLQSEKLAAMGQMIAGVAHELNNPLTAILGVSDLIRERAAEQERKDQGRRDAGGTSEAGYKDLARHADLAHQQARRAAEIVQNLLAFARPPALKKAPVSLNDLVRRTLQLHEYALRVNNIAVDFVPVPDLPPVMADANQLVQVFLNLVINAEQALREPATGPDSPAPDRGKLRVRLGQERFTAEGGSFDPPRRTQGRDSRIDSGAERVWVSFADDGPGIPPDILPKIFDPFFTTKRPGRGTGLGLSICLAIVKEHGGTIDVQSAPGQGATFTVRLPLTVPSESRGTVSLPLARAEEKELPHRTQREDEAGGLKSRRFVRDSGTAEPPLPFGHEPQGKRKSRVLVVEDEESIRELVRDGLTRWGAAGDEEGAEKGLPFDPPRRTQGRQGWEVECVGSGMEAVAAAAALHKEGRHYDVVLCDLKMPGMNGVQVYERLKTRLDGSPQPFLFMTGDLADDVTLRFLHENNARSISKPFKMAELVSALQGISSAAETERCHPGGSFTAEDNRRDAGAPKHADAKTT